MHYMSTGYSARSQTQQFYRSNRLDFYRLNMTINEEHRNLVTDKLRHLCVGVCASPVRHDQRSLIHTTHLSLSRLALSEARISLISQQPLT